MKAKDLVVSSRFMVNQEEKFLSDIQENGCSDLRLEHYQSRGSGHGTLPSTQIYRIVGTQHAVREYVYGYVEGIAVTFFFEKDFFSKQKEFARICGKLSKKYKVPFDVALAIGTDESLYKDFIDALYEVTYVSGYTYEDLQCGIQRRKSALQKILGDQVYYNLVAGMGQDHSSRIAGFVRSVITDRDVVNFQYDPGSSWVKLSPELVGDLMSFKKRLKKQS